MKKVIQNEKVEILNNKKEENINNQEVSELGFERKRRKR